MYARLVIAAILVATVQAKDSDDLRPLLAEKLAKSDDANHGAHTSTKTVADTPTQPAQSDTAQADLDDSDIDADVDDSKPQQDVTPQAPPRKIEVTEKPHQSFGKQTASTTDPVMNGLKDALASLKRNEINVDQLQREEASSKALLRESQEMLRGATSKHSRQAYERQVHQSETVEKESLSLQQEGKAAAAEDARAALREANVVQNVAKALAAEANSQLRLFAKAVAPAPKASSASSSDDADDDLDMD